MTEDVEELRITAGELRARGISIAANIPDCGWIPYGSMRVEVKSDPTEGGEDDRTITGLGFDLVFEEPFRWVELDGVIEL